MAKTFNAYWDAILKEVLNKHNQCYPVRFTVRMGREHAGRHQAQRYYLKAPRQREYLTAREYDCAQLMLHGGTLASMGQTLGLSARTVEYYVQRMKGKLGCRRKATLIAVLQRVL